jgi:hypothetical protein
LRQSILTVPDFKAKKVLRISDRCDSTWASMPDKRISQQRRYRKIFRGTGTSIFLGVAVPDSLLRRKEGTGEKLRTRHSIGDDSGMDLRSLGTAQERLSKSHKSCILKLIDRYRMEVKQARSISLYTSHVAGGEEAGCTGKKAGNNVQAVCLPGTITLNSNSSRNGVLEAKTHQEYACWRLTLTIKRRSLERSTLQPV